MEHSPTDGGSTEGERGGSADENRGGAFKAQDALPASALLVHRLLQHGQGPRIDTVVFGGGQACLCQSCGDLGGDVE